jgi:hypothetical protein
MPRRKVDLFALSRPSALSSIGLIRRIVPLSLVNETLNEQKRQSKRERLLPAHFTVYLVIAFSLYMPYSLREVHRCVVEGLRTLDRALSPSFYIATKGAISRARSRLGFEVLASLFEKVARPIATKKTKGAWYRRWRVMLIDGTCLALQRTPENEEAFGIPDNMYGGCAFPVLRLIALVEAGTRVVVRAALGDYKSHELRLAEQLLPSLGEGMLLIEDRGYVGYNWWKAVAGRGCDILCRVRKNMHLPCRKALSDGSYLSELKPPVGSDGKPIPVRVIEYWLEGVSGSEPLYRLITTILDYEESPAQELAALYHERWEVETLFDEFKTHIRGGGHVLLRSRTPEMVKQETYGLLLAHFTVRSVMHDAALLVDEDPDELSFIHTVRVLRRRLPQAAAVFSPSGSIAMVQDGAGGSLG